MLYINPESLPFIGCTVGKDLVVLNKDYHLKSVFSPYNIYEFDSFGTCSESKKLTVASYLSPYVKEKKPGEYHGIPPNSRKKMMLFFDPKTLSNMIVYMSSDDDLIVILAIDYINYVEKRILRQNATIIVSPSVRRSFLCAPGIRTKEEIKSMEDADMDLAFLNRLIFQCYLPDYFEVPLKFKVCLGDTEGVAPYEGFWCIGKDVGDGSTIRTSIEVWETKASALQCFREGTWERTFHYLAEHNNNIASLKSGTLGI